MKVRLAVIGRKDTIERIKNITPEFEDKVDALYFVYEDKRELVDILNRYQSDVDVIVFSGSVPYYYAKSVNALIKPAVYTGRVESSMYEVFWKIRDEGIDYTRMSIDAINKQALKEVLDSLNISIENIYVKAYKPDVEYEELVAYHYELWKDKKINAAATGMSMAAKRLCELGVPVYKLFPTSQLIRECINNAIYIADVERIKGTQNALQIIKIKNKKSDTLLEYDFLKQRNKLETFLIEYAQENMGAFLPFGGNEYLIFTTRGALNNVPLEEKLKKIINVEKNLGITIASGIGYGDTVHKAEINARIALDYAMKEDYCCCYAVDEEGVILGPIGKNNVLNLSYDLIVTDEKIQKIADEINTSPAYVSKIKSIITTTGNNVIDADTLSNYLGISLRSSRRILNQIIQAGYGKVIGKGSKSSTGRPRRIVEILL